MKKWFVGVGLFLCLNSTGAFAATEYEKFFGTYVGETNDVSNQKEIRRDLSVTIEPTDDGFRINWKTISVRKDGRTKDKAYSVDFFPSDRDNIYSSAMKSNLFGGRQPLDPMKGDPYVWANIHGDTLIVNALIITEDGGYEMLTYNRTLTDYGMVLAFDRVQDGVPQTRVDARLEKVE